MNDIPRLTPTYSLSALTSWQVEPARPVADRTQAVPVAERRRQPDRRKRNRRPRVERRVSSDRRRPRFDAKA